MESTDRWPAGGAAAPRIRAGARGRGCRYRAPRSGGGGRDGQGAGKGRSENGRRTGSGRAGIRQEMCSGLRIGAGRSVPVRCALVTALLTAPARKPQYFLPLPSHMLTFKMSRSLAWMGADYGFACKPVDLLFFLVSRISNVISEPQV